MKRRVRNSHSVFMESAGFTLVELLVVVGMVGVFMAAVFSLYQTHHRSAYTQEEAVEVQQNLRVGLDRILDDIRMSGFLVPGGTTPVAFVAGDDNGGPNGSDRLTLTIASSAVAIARNTTPNQTVTLVATDTIHLSVDSITMLAVTDNVILVGSQDNNLVINDTFQVTTANDIPDGPCGAGVAAAPCVSLQATAGGTGTIKPGDIVVVTGGGPYPNNIQYQLINAGCPVGPTCLQRNGFDVNGPQIVADNVTGLQLNYMLQNGLEVADPTGVLNQVRGIRVTLTGQRVNTTGFTGGVAQAKNLVSVAGIRNF